ncbi:hypothetical protein BC332_25907 [Capsicum chinense]|nr:hypothetical protein BC332_25907 [Capsicum chinense]
MARCLCCQKVKAEHMRPGGLLQRLPILEWKWERITMDFMTGLPHTSHDSDSVWVIVDRLTKSSYFIPVQDELGNWVDLSTIFHAQIEGQSERTIQILEDMLYACVIDFGGPWEQHLALEKFAYNNSYYYSIDMTHFEYRLRAAQSRQKCYTDRRLRALRFGVSYRVFLRVSLMKGVMRFVKRGKLSPSCALELSLGLRFSGDIDCNEVLDLRVCSITDAIPSTLGNLSSLAIIYISSNGLSGMVSSSLSRLESLPVLDLSHKLLIGSIPASFGSLGNLILPDISSNLLTGAISPVIGNVAFKKLKFLNLSQNMFYGNLPPVIRRFSFVDLTDNYFQGKVPEHYGQSNVFFNRNCLQRLESQRDTSECASFYDEHGLLFDNFRDPNAMELPVPNKSDKTSHNNVIISAAVLGDVGIIAIVIIFVLLLICCCKSGGTNQRVTGVEHVPISTSPPLPPSASLKFLSLGVVFSYLQILQTTGDFSDANLIKHGHSGDIFHGILEGGIHVVVKRIDSSKVKRKVYKLELDFFSKVSQSRLVPLLGYCLESENEKFLVYRYMPNGDLASSFFKKKNTDDDSLQSLYWITILKIAIGAAEGLSYLHHECSLPLVHR